MYNFDAFKDEMSNVGGTEPVDPDDENITAGQEENVRVR
jgi:hypothetical protein